MANFRRDITIRNVYSLRIARAYRPVCYRLTIDNIPVPPRGGMLSTLALCKKDACYIKASQFIRTVLV